MELQRARILLVEDDPDDVWVMRGLLGDRWDGPFELIHVEMLAAGLQHCARGNIDVVLLDLTLPDSNGLETFLMMHAHAGDIPIVVLTGDRNEAVGVKAVQAGAQDYLVKGQVDDHLLVRCVRYAIERARRERAEHELRATSEEFRVAQQIQQRLYPTEPPTLEGFDVAGAIYPAKATAGDHFDYIPLGQRRIGIVVGDVSGHGMGPALLMAETRASLRALVQTYSDPGEILTRTNRVLTTDSEEFHFVTLMFAAIDCRARSLVHAGAGQRGYVLDPSGDATPLDSTSIPLGIDEHLVVPSAKPVALRSGQIIALFTDGVVETESPDRLRFGARHALSVIHSHRQKPARQIVDGLHQSINEFARHRPQVDDITIVIVKVE